MEVGGQGPGGGSSTSPQAQAKRRAGERAADFVQDGLTIGLGTGSTVYWTILRLGERVRQGLRIRGIPTSQQTADLAVEHGIPLTTFDSVHELDLAIDGADEIDPNLNLIKGAGGALLREKIVARASRRLIIVADESKLVSQLGRGPVPVEIAPFGHAVTEARLAAFGGVPRLRRVDGAPALTDNGNFVVDTSFGPIADPTTLQRELKLLTGVIDTGLFLGLADLAVIGTPTGVSLLHRTTPGADVESR